MLNRSKWMVLWPPGSLYPKKQQETVDTAVFLLCGIPEWSKNFVFDDMVHSLIELVSIHQPSSFFKKKMVKFRCIVCLDAINKWLPKCANVQLDMTVIVTLQFYSLHPNHRVVMVKILPCTWRKLICSFWSPWKSIMKWKHRVSLAFILPWIEYTHINHNETRRWHSFHTLISENEGH